MITPIIPHAGEEGIIWPLISSLTNEFPAVPTLVGDDSGNLKKRWMPSNTTLIKGPRRGFAANVNNLARQVKTDWILLLNNDVVMHTGSGKRLRKYLRWVSKRVGLVATTIWQEDGQLDSFGDSFSWMLGRPVKRGRGTQDVIRADRLPLLSVSGAVMLVRTKTWQELGGFDEGFAQYYEDVDFGWRAMAAGWRIDSLAGCNSTHLESQTFKPVVKAYYGARNNLWLIRRHQPNDEGLLRRAERVWRFKARRSPADVATAIERGLKDGRQLPVPPAPSKKIAVRQLSWQHPTIFQEWGTALSTYRHRSF